MGQSLATSIRRLRKERGLSQQQLADKLYVDRSSVAHWEIGRRVPDASILSRLADTFNVDVNALVSDSEDDLDKPNVIMVDDEKIILNGSMNVLEGILTDAHVSGFDNPTEALDYSRKNRVDLAFLDIELGKMSGLDLCKELLLVNPKMNVVFLTAHSDYSYAAWETGASGFMLKPLTPEGIRKQLSLLRYPIKGLART